MCALTINYEPSLAKRTSLKLGGNAIAEILIQDFKETELLPCLIKQLGGTAKVIGRGTNILCRDSVDVFGAAQSKEPLPIVLIKPNFSSKAVILSEQYDADGVQRSLVHVGANCNLPILLHFLADNSLSGLEGLAGVPGNVGGAVAMNAGSYGNEISDCLHSVTIFTLANGVQILKADDFTCSYRSFKPKCIASGELFIILEAVFACKSLDFQQIFHKMKDNIALKKSTQPLTAFSAGCLFKNPATGLSAGHLLDNAGFKGRELGGMAFSDIHANFLINKGTGTSAQAFELIEKAQNTVLDLYGVKLEMEVKVWP